MINSFFILFLSKFYIGFIKYAPGTISSLTTILISWFFIPDVFIIKIVILLFLILISYPILFFHLNSLNDVNKDPQYVVIDEVIGMLVSVLLLPKEFLVYFFAFILFRFFDIIKPSIIYESQKIKNGIGVLLDDILAGAFTLIILCGIFNV